MALPPKGDIRLAPRRQIRNASGNQGRAAQTPQISFSSESLLREAMRGLLSRIPEVSLVQLTHGPQELGKDLVFYLAGGLGEKMLCACVVKNAPLDGRSAGSPRGALSILHQAEQSLLNSKKCENGTEAQVQKVFIVTPYDLPDSTITAIFGHLKDRAGRVEFIGGAKLFELFRKHWPEFISDESAAIREYLRVASERLKDERSLEQVAITYALGLPDRTIIRYYVQPHFHQKIVAAKINSSIFSIIHSDFAPVMIKLPRRAGESSDRWSPAQPHRILISASDLGRGAASRETLSQILTFLEEWEYCDRGTRENLIEQYRRYLDLVARIREEHVRVDDADPASTIRQLSKNSRGAELTISETNVVETEARSLSAAVKSALQRLQRDLETTTAVVLDKSFDGVDVLKDERYRIATRIADMFFSAPAGLFADARREIEVDKSKNTIAHANHSSDEVEADAADVVMVRTIVFPSDFLDSYQGSVVIAGAAGFGKTSFCRWHALDDAEHFASGKTERLWAYFPLHEIARGQPRSFEETFLTNIGQSALIPGDSSKATAAGRAVRLYLDGLDEVPLQELRTEILSKVNQGLKKRPNIQVVLTTRDYVVGPWINWLPRFHLSRFNDGQIKELLTNWFDSDIGRRDLFYRQLEKSPALKDLLSVPLLATLVILIFRLTGNLPSSRKRLYEMFVDLLNASWDLAKGVQRGAKFGPVLKMAVLRRIAYAAHSKRERHFSLSLLKSAIGGILKSDASLKGRWREILEEILQDGVLVSAGSDYSFAHLSFQEFLAASSLAGDPNNHRRAQILSSYLKGDNWWREVLKFYLELSANTKELGDWISQGSRAITKADGEGSTEAQAHALIEHLRISFPELAI